MENRKLYLYQNRAAWHLYHHRRQALYAGLGSGKTATVLYVLQKLLAERAITKCLVVAPVAVAKSVWAQEALEWPRLQGLTFSKVLGSAKQRTKALEADADIYLINYENLLWLFNLPGYEDLGFDALVLDESTMVQNPSSVRFRGKTRPKQFGLKDRVADFEYVYTMSGTPKPGEYLGLWSQIYCLDQGALLGKNITEFKRRYYVQYGPHHYMIKVRNRQAETDIQNRLKQICYRIPSEEVAAVLPQVVERTRLIELPAKAKKIYREVEDDFFTMVGEGEVTVDNVAIKAGKLQQVCQGAVYTDEGEVKKIHDEKLDHLDSLVSDLGDERCLVIYTFKHDVDRLLAWREAPVLRASMPEKAFNVLVGEWNAGEHPVIYGHPKSMGHGMNLQGGGFNVIFFGLTWSLDYYQQTIGRLRRSGQKASTVFVHRLVCSDTIETELMLPRLRAKSESQRDFLNSFSQYRKLRL